MIEEESEVSRVSPEFITKHRCGLQTFVGVFIFIVSINSLFTFLFSKNQIIIINLIFFDLQEISLFFSSLSKNVLSSSPAPLSLDVF